METITNREFGGERPLYRSENTQLDHVTIHEGESSLKECRNISADDCRFEGKYVFWENDGVTCTKCYFAPSARASFWYSGNISIHDCIVDAPKFFRRARHIHIDNVQIPHAEETFWDCSDIHIVDSRIAEADYLFMHSSDIRIRNYRQDGNYSFQYAANVEISNAVINSKDSFWESENCTLIDCEINGEYLGWYSRNMRLVRCHITGKQPLCYCSNLILEDCTFGEDCDFILEYSTVQATIKGFVQSIRNPTSGSITVDECPEIIINNYRKSPADCRIIVNNDNKL